MGTVYLIHFDQPYRHARHYLGFSNDPIKRLDAHRASRGARLMQVVNAAGITWQCVRTWNGSRQDERRLKKYKAARLLCPLCSERPRPAERSRPAYTTT